MKEKIDFRKISVGRYIGIFLVVLFLLVEIYPIFWMLMAALKSPAEFISKPSYAFPEGLYLENFKQAWTVGKMSLFFKNSVLATSTALFFIIFLSSTIAFALSKMKWKLSKFIRGVFISGILVPVQVVLIPLFMIYKKIGIINSLGCLSLTYIAFGLAMSVFLLISYYSYIPNDLMEAAVIDGCGIYRLFILIIFPLLKNGIVTVLVIQFFTTWNDLLFSMTFISSQKLKTIQTGLLYFQDEWGNKEWGPIFASVTISVTPTILIYGILNKLVIEGMTAGAVKG